jgi:hypothetical protein
MAVVTAGAVQETARLVGVVADRVGREEACSLVMLEVEPKVEAVGPAVGEEEEEEEEEEELSQVQVEALVVVQARLPRVARPAAAPGDLPVGLRRSLALAWVPVGRVAASKRRAWVVGAGLHASSGK